MSVARIRGSQTMQTHIALSLSHRRHLHTHVTAATPTPLNCTLYRSRYECEVPSSHVLVPGAHTDEPLLEIPVLQFSVHLYTPRPRMSKAGYLEPYYRAAMKLHELLVCRQLWHCFSLDAGEGWPCTCPRLELPGVGTCKNRRWGRSRWIACRHTASRAGDWRERTLPRAVLS